MASDSSMVAAPRRHDQYILDGHLSAGMHSAAEQVNGEARQRVRRRARSAPRNAGTAARRALAALARAKATETARIAFAPRRDLLGVPSSSIKRAIQFGLMRRSSRPARLRCISPSTLRDGLSATQAGVAPPVAIAKFQRLGCAGGCARRHGSGARRPARQGAGCADGRTAAAIQNFSRRSGVR